MKPPPCFIPEPRRRVRTRRRHTTAWATAIGAAALAITLAAAHTVMTTGRDENPGVSRRALADAQGRAAGLQRELDRAVARRDEIAGLVDAASSLTSAPDWSVLLVYIASRCQGRASLRELQLRPVDADEGVWGVTLRGVANGRTEVTDIIADLAASGVFSKTHLSEVTATEEQAILFRISCVLGGQTETSETADAPAARLAGRGATP